MASPLIVLTPLYLPPLILADLYLQISPLFYIIDTANFSRNTHIFSKLIASYVTSTIWLEGFRLAILGTTAGLVMCKMLTKMFIILLAKKNRGNLYHLILQYRRIFIIFEYMKPMVSFVAASFLFAGLCIIVGFWFTAIRLYNSFPLWIYMMFPSGVLIQTAVANMVLVVTIEVHEGSDALIRKWATWISSFPSVKERKLMKRMLHSLGAHLSGRIGTEIQEIMGGRKLPRITGLDPAGPLFDFNPEWNIDKSDAYFVDIYHSNAGLAGDTTLNGHVDFMC
ncbi:Lipase member H [Folsomia candida]|uniref:Lipase member H n=1 Tax=Folsomia candida TaxID=158441 RepID=A0A226DJ80_FOLCA|nr:Lipase member H [Folsomia candida]